jgi:very-short-patch-repair endonuclease
MHYIKKYFARQLRKNQTSAEELLWKVLKNRKYLGLKFRRQFVIDGFVVDFYCHELELVIELDGDIHKKQRDYDNFRQSIIQKRKTNFLRFKNQEVLENIGKVLEKIKSLSLQQKINPPKGG